MFISFKYPKTLLFVMFEYDLELDRLIEMISEKNYKKIVVQLPDGLKPRAKEIVDFIYENLNNECEVIVWAGTCFGSCDLPSGVDSLGVDACIQWGHEVFKKSQGWREEGK